MERFHPRTVAAAALACTVLAGCAASGGRIATYQPPPGINQVLEGAIEAAPGNELVIGDIVMAAGGEIPPHTHYGEEFIYCIGGSATVSRKGYADVILKPGDSLRVAPGVVHWGLAGADGVRVVSAWVKPLDKPLRVPAER